MKTVLVTGSTGFVGRNLISRLEKLQYKIYISNTKICSLNNIDNLKEYDNIKFDYIFHLAAKTKAGDWCKYHKGEQWIDNQILNTNMLKYWLEAQLQAKLITFGTSCSYGPSDLPLKEDDYLKYEPDIDLYTYAMTKRMLLVGCQSLAEQYGLKYIHYVPSTLYGPNFDISDTHFIFDLIKKISDGRYKNKIVELWGTGYQKRELVYIDNAIDIVLSTLDLENKVINIASGEDYSIRSYAKEISEILGYDYSRIIYDDTKFTGVKRKILSTDQLKYFLPDDFKFVDLKQGLHKTIKYYLENYE
jgi:GDP-L-fucose synthase